jgi:predicted amidophosphoribosyltransferase
VHPRRALTLALSLIAPPRCGACSAACELDEPLCEGCRAILAGGHGHFLSVPFTDTAWAATTYGATAQRLVTALKFSGRLALAEAAADAIVASLPPGLADGAVVPVPPAPARRRARGFDPTALIAGALAARLALPLLPSLRRDDGPRQVGRPRRLRLADPPRIEVDGDVPEVATLVDDVTTTGATLSACAQALRAAGTRRVIALAFSHTPGTPRLAPGLTGA